MNRAEQRPLASSTVDSSAAAAAAAERIMPTFSERFLFDDELEATDDSAFMRRYNLAPDEDDFPLLLRQPPPLSRHPPVSHAATAQMPTGIGAALGAPRSHAHAPPPPTVPQLSTFSSALDLAPLSHMTKRSSAQSAQDAMSLSPWLHAERLHARGSSVGEGGGSAGGSGSNSGANTPNAQASFGGMPSFLPRELPSATAAAAAAAAAAASATSVSGSPATASTPPSLGSFAATIPGLAAVGSHPTSFHGGSSSLVPSLMPNAHVDALNGRAAAAAAAAAGTELGGADVGRLGSRLARKRHTSTAAPSGENVRGSVDDGASRHMRRSDVDLASMQLEDLRGDIAQLCRDQFGCRFLQKKLDEGVPAQCDLIFEETFQYFAELMTDPFGNYLCQKLLEHCTNAQRDQIVESIADDLVNISLNMHGTRAVQKTIDFLSTRAQTQVIIQAFSRHVVTLIKDLNGNHVIQKCLHRLDAYDNQFIYDAVAAQCVDVATHRHGCCVLQRCIDHASETQRLQLVREITMYSLALVQDPFGNYVVQYVLDLNEPSFTTAITNEFLGHVCQLSTQKFSSNVMEKCLRVAEPPIRHKLVAELVDASRLELLLRDSFANYVVQTCLDYAEPAQRAQLVECIRPILPSIRHTPYGKRIQSKLQRDAHEPKHHHHRRDRDARLLKQSNSNGSNGPAQQRVPSKRMPDTAKPVSAEATHHNHTASLTSALQHMHLGSYAAAAPDDMVLATSSASASVGPRPW